MSSLYQNLLDIWSGNHQNNLPVNAWLTGNDNFLIGYFDSVEGLRTLVVRLDGIASVDGELTRVCGTIASGNTSWDGHVTMNCVRFQNVIVDTILQQIETASMKQDRLQ
jgi:hypothetical protein